MFVIKLKLIVIVLVALAGMLVPSLQSAGDAHVVANPTYYSPHTIWELWPR